MNRSIVMLAAALTPAGAAAQYRTPEPPRPAWLGFGYDVRWVQHDGVCRPQVVVESLVQGAPAERAGLRSGDAIVALDGQPVAAARLQLIASRLSPGDSVRLRVARAGSVRELVAVADRRPARPPATVTATLQPDGLFRTSAPVIEFIGDTLVARNIEGLHTWGGPGGYYVARGDGPAEFRRLTSRGGEELDRRVAELLVCAESSRLQASHQPVVTRVEVQRRLDRADSLRILMARRAFERQDEDRDELFRRLEQEARQNQRVVITHASPTPMLRFEDHMAAAERGVAGAELTALDPKLAEYFRGVRTGVLVLRVAAGSPAAAAGLVPGDVIIAGPGRTIDSVSDLRRLLTLPDPGPVELRVIRHGRQRAITIPRE